MPALPGSRWHLFPSTIRGQESVLNTPLPLRRKGKSAFPKRFMTSMEHWWWTESIVLCIRPKIWSSFFSNIPLPKSSLRDFHSPTKRSMSSGLWKRRRRKHVTSGWRLRWKGWCRKEELLRGSERQQLENENPHEAFTPSKQLLA